MSNIGGKNNKSTERRLRAYLIQSGLRGWQLRVRGILGTPDFVFDDAKLVVFVNGCFWHGCFKCGRLPKSRRNYWRKKLERNVQRDRECARRLRRQGWRVMTVWEHELKSSAPSIIAKIKQLVSVG
ncbi:MAG: very short patch repair endonuclease [Candidatus Obscuribacterales bacterium]|nr:very short patch repair endonuclease [Candidatus Obscuribacterales bacterium]